MGGLPPPSSADAGGGGTTALEQRHHGLDADVAPALTPPIRLALQFIVAVVDLAPPRVVPIFGAGRKALDMWSDASYEMELVTVEDWVPVGGPCRMGYVFRKHADLVPANTVGATADLEDTVLKKFLPKKQQISQCELFTAYTAIANEEEKFRDADVLWYIDNVSAAMALIKGASAKADLSAMAVAIHAIFARLNCRVWVEYVESASNPADGLSRDGLGDAWTRAQGWQLKTVPCPAFFQMDSAIVESVVAIVHGAIP